MNPPQGPDGFPVNKARTGKNKLFRFPGSLDFLWKQTGGEEKQKQDPWGSKYGNRQHPGVPLGGSDFRAKEKVPYQPE